MDPLHLVVVVHLLDAIFLTIGIKNDNWSTAGNDTQLKTRIVTISHLQCINKYAYQIFCGVYLSTARLGLILAPVVEAIGRPEFKDNLRMGVLLEATGALLGNAPSQGSIPNPLRDAG